MMNDLPTREASFYRKRELEPDLPQRSWRKRILQKALDRYEIVRFIRSQDVIVALDTRDQRWAEECFRRNVQVVRSGVDSGVFRFRNRSIPRDRPLRLLLAGVFFAHRRFEDAVDALRILTARGRDAVLTIVGDESSDPRYASAIRSRVEHAHLSDRVVFRGRIREDELRREYDRNDIFLFPSHLQSWGLAVFEAMASGLPVVVSRTAGASEVLINGETALLVGPKDPAGIAAAIERLASDPNLYRKLGQQGRIFVEREMSWTRYAKDLLALFESARQSYRMT